MPSHLYDATDTANLQTYTTPASFTPVAGEAVVVWVAVESATAGGTLTASANSLTFTRVARAVKNASGEALLCYVANQVTPGSPAAMTLTIDATDVAAATGCQWSVESAPVGAYGASALAQTAATQDNGGTGASHTVTFSTAPAAGNAVYAATVCGANPAGITEPTGFTETADIGHASPTRGMESARIAGSSPQTVTWATTSATAKCTIAVELVAASAGFAGSAALTGSGTLASAGAPAIPGTASLTGSGTLAASGVPKPTGAAALTGSGTLAAAGSPAVPGAATLSGAGSLSAAGAPAVPGTAALSGSGTLTAVAGGFAGSATLSGSGALTATGAPAAPGSAALTGSGTLTVATVPRPTGLATLTGSGTLTTTGVPAATGTAALTGTGTLTAAGLPRPTGVAAFTGSGTLAAAGVVPTAVIAYLGASSTRSGGAGSSRSGAAGSSRSGAASSVGATLAARSRVTTPA